MCWCGMAIIVFMLDGDQCVGVGWRSVRWCGMAISVLVWDGDQCVGV